MLITKEEYIGALPKSLKGKVNDEVINNINTRLTECTDCEGLRSNLVGYNHIIRGGKFSMQEYLNAVTYVSYKFMGINNRQSYCKTFPIKYANFVKEGVIQKTIDRYVHAFNGSKLVNLIYEAGLIPTHILNADVFQEAINTQAELMRDPDVSPKVRSDAANSLMTHLKRPEAQKIELDIGIKEHDSITELKEVTRQLAIQQSKLIQEGLVSVKETAESRIINGSYEEV